MTQPERPGEADRKQLVWLWKHLPVLLVSTALGGLLGPWALTWFTGDSGGAIGVVLGMVAGLILGAPLQLLVLFVVWCVRRLRPQPQVPWSKRRRGG